MDHQKSRSTENTELPATEVHLGRLPRETEPQDTMTGKPDGAKDSTEPGSSLRATDLDLRKMNAGDVAERAQGLSDSEATSLVVRLGLGGNADPLRNAIREYREEHGQAEIDNLLARLAKGREHLSQMEAQQSDSDALAAPGSPPRPPDAPDSPSPVEGTSSRFVRSELDDEF